MSARRMIRRATLMAVLLAAATARVDAQSIKLGVFDPQRVSEETAAGKRVQTELSSFRERKQAQIKDKEKALEELQKQLTQQALSLSPDKRSELEKNIQRQASELQSSREAANRELQIEISAAQNNFQEKLLAVVGAFGKDEGFTVILEESLVAWASDTVDVTTAIVDRFDKMFPVPTQ